VGERYGDGFTDETPLIGWSVTKSVTNALVGATIYKYPGELELTQKNLLPEWENDARADITLSHLLQMESGLSWHEGYMAKSDVTSMLFTKTDHAEFAAQKPLQATPGTEWYYSSGTTNLIQKVLRNFYVKVIQKTINQQTE
jgi:CubicO group peptidase (beta-lactamase class C family)